jgi:hypothetical protein
MTDKSRDDVVGLPLPSSDASLVKAARAFYESGNASDRPWDELTFAEQ